jgi:hypothetical protein
VARRLTADPVAWFTAERVNLLAAVERACQAGWLDLAQQLASDSRAVSGHWQVNDKGRTTDWISYSKGFGTAEEKYMACCIFLAEVPRAAPEIFAVGSSTSPESRNIA